MQVIGLTGFAGAGKSTVANYLVEAHGFTRLSFAGPLKKMLRTLDPYLVPSPVAGFGDDEPLRLSDLLSVMTEDEIKAGSAGKEYRRLLQVLGTDCIRAVDEDFWVNAAAEQMDDQDRNYVFDDVRFPNEAFIIKSCSPNGLWKVDAPGCHAANDHPSETHSGRMGETVWIMNGFNQFDYLHAQIDVALGNVE